MSFEADRESFFEKLNSEIMNVAKKGFPALSFLVSLKNQSVHRFPIPKTSRSDLNCYSNINTDRISSQLYPLDASVDHLPIQVYGDGNCFYGSLSLLVFGHDKFYKEMRVRVVFEMVSNLKLYTDCDTFSNMANSSMSIDYLYQTLLHFDNLVKDDRLDYCL